jgi:hypothetical protein
VGEELISKRKAHEMTDTRQTAPTVTRRGPSPALVVSVIALVAALTGTAGALPGRNTVDGNDVKRNAIKSKAIKNGQVKRADIAGGAVAGAQIADGAVAGAEIADDAVAGAQIADGAVAGAQIADGAVAGAQIADGAVAGAEIADGAVAAADLAPQKPYHAVGSPGEPPFFDGGEGDCVWKNGADSTFAPASFQKDALGRVHLRGVVSGADGTGGDGKCDSAQPGEAEDGVVFILPEGYRPEYVSLSAIVAQIAILPDQGALFASGPVPPGAVFSALTSTAALDSASFSAASAATAQQAKAPAKLSLGDLRRPGG